MEEMDVSGLNIHGEWLELETEYKKFGTFKVKVVPIQINSLMNIINENLAKHVADVIVDWNLMSGEEKIPCNDENKNKYLPILAMWRIKNPKHALKGKMFETVGAEIIAFARNIENFTKN